MVNVNNNVNGQTMVESKEARESRLAALENKLGNLRESTIWQSTGGKFETVFGDYMTSKQVAAFFNLEWDDVNNKSNTLSWYTRTTSEYVGELNNAGMKLYSKSEINDLASTFQTGVQHPFENDATDSVTFSNRGMTLWTLKSVTRLGMFMTKTESAKLFRDSIIDELQAGVTFKKAYQSTTQAYLQQMELSAQQGHIFDIGLLNDVMDSIAVTSKLCYKNEILETVETLTKVSDTYRILLSKLDCVKDRRKYDQIQFIINQISASISDLQQIVIALDKVRLDANTSKELYNRSQILKDAIIKLRNETDKEYNRRLRVVQTFLIKAGYIKEKIDYQAPSRDEKGNKILLDKDKCISENNIFVGIDGRHYEGSRTKSYVPSDKNKAWIFNNEYVMKPDVKNQILKFTPVGRSLWGALYRQANEAYDIILKQATARLKEDEELNIEDFISAHPKYVDKVLNAKITLTKEEFEAQYAFVKLNDDAQNNIILL